MSARRSLVTGGCGFIGRHLVKALLERGDEVWIIDDLSHGIDLDKWVSSVDNKNIEGETTTYEYDSIKISFVRSELATLLDREPKMPYFDEIYHLAAIVGGRAKLIAENPLLISKNLAIDSSFFLWAVRNKERIGRILYMSSCVAYSQDLYMKEGDPIKETDYMKPGRSPESIYGWIKMNGEYLARMASNHYGLKCVCARPFSGYGADQDLNYPIPSIANRVALRENPLIIWGSGKQARDFVYIDDLVSALMLATQNIEDGSGINIGSGTPTSFLRVASILSKLESYSPQIKTLADKPEGARCVYADNSLLKSFGWNQTIPLEEGLKRVLDNRHEELRQKTGAT